MTSFIVSVHQASGSGLPGWFWLRISQEVAITLRLDWGWRTIFQTHSCGCWQGASVPHHADLSIGYLHVFTYGSWLPPEQLIKGREPETQDTAFCNLTLEVTHHHFCCILWVIQLDLGQLGGWLPQEWTVGSHLYLLYVSLSALIP